MPPDKMSSAQAQAVPIIGTVSDPATLPDTTMTQSQNPVAVIASAMKTHGIVPADFDIASIEDEYALMAALRQHTKAAQVKLFDGADLRSADLRGLTIASLSQHFKGSLISHEQAAELVGGLGVRVM